MIVTISYVGSKYVTQPYKRPIYSQHDTTPDIMYECNHLHVEVVHSTVEQGRERQRREESKTSMHQ